MSRDGAVVSRQLLIFTSSVVPSQISGFRTSFETELSRIRASDTSGSRILGLVKRQNHFGCHFHNTGVGNLRCFKNEQEILILF